MPPSLLLNGLAGKSTQSISALWTTAPLARIDAFLKLGLQQGCSDIHLAVGVPPLLRVHGELLPIKFRDLRDSELQGYLQEILTQSQRDLLARGEDLDFAYVSEDGGRFRVNLYRKETGVGAAE